MDKSFSKRTCGFAFHVYPDKMRTMPNISVRHIHPGVHGSGASTPVDLNTYTCGKYWIQAVGWVDCGTVLTPNVLKLGINNSLYDSNRYTSEWFHGIVQFKTKISAKQYARDWYIKPYKHTYTGNSLRHIIYHNCLGEIHKNRTYKGLFDHLLPYLRHPNACQVCKTPVPPSLLTVLKLNKMKA